MEAARRQENAGIRGLIRAHRLAAFGVLVVLFTVAIGLVNLGDTAPYALIFVPAISALIVAGVADGRTGIANLFRRIARWRVRPIWYVVAIGIPLVVWLGIDLAGVLLGAPASGLFKNLGELPLVIMVTLIPASLRSSAGAVSQSRRRPGPGRCWSLDSWWARCSRFPIWRCTCRAASTPTCRCGPCS